MSYDLSYSCLIYTYNFLSQTLTPQTAMIAFTPVITSVSMILVTNNALTMSNLLASNKVSNIWCMTQYTITSPTIASTYYYAIGTSALILFIPAFTIG